MVSQVPEFPDLAIYRVDQIRAEWFVSTLEILELGVFQNVFRNNLAFEGVVELHSCIQENPHQWFLKFRNPDMIWKFGGESKPLRWH